MLQQSHWTYQIPYILIVMTPICGKKFHKKAKTMQLSMSPPDLAPQRQQKYKRNTIRYSDLKRIAKIFGIKTIEKQPQYLEDQYFGVGEKKDGTINGLFIKYINGFKKIVISTHCPKKRTMAHELGHFILGHIDTLESKASVAQEAKEMELEADYFAAIVMNQHGTKPKKHQWVKKQAEYMLRYLESIR